MPHRGTCQRPLRSRRRRRTEPHRSVNSVARNTMQMVAIGYLLRWVSTAGVCGACAGLCVLRGQAPAHLVGPLLLVLLPSPLNATETVPDVRVQPRHHPLDRSLHSRVSRDHVACSPQGIVHTRRGGQICPHYGRWAGAFRFSGEPLCGAAPNHLIALTDVGGEIKCVVEALAIGGAL